MFNKIPFSKKHCLPIVRLHRFPGMCTRYSTLHTLYHYAIMSYQV